jgi:kynurenine formamidase
MSDEPMTSVLSDLAAGLGRGAVGVVDLSHPLSEDTPAIQLPPPKVSPPPFRIEELSRYDERGEHEYWNTLQLPEHIGTHFDAPIHWFTGRELADVGAVAPETLIRPAAVLDCSAKCAADSDYLVTVEDLAAFEAEYGPLPDGGWLLIRTGWDERAGDAVRFLNKDDEGRPHWPGLSVEAARFLAQESGVIGVGIDTIGTDAGISHGFDPPHPGHHYIHGAGKYGMSSLANLDRLPPVGALVITAPLRIAGGSGSPLRPLALVTREPSGQ